MTPVPRQLATILQKKKKHPLADGKQNSSHHPPGDSNTLA